MRKKILVWLLMFSLLLSAGPVSCAKQKEAPLPSVRMDRDDPDSWKRELDNVRLITKDRYEFGEVKEKYGIDPDYVPSDKGLDTLCISGSAQFSQPQFLELAETLRECADGRTVYIIDLRQESHVLVNEGIPLSWYGSHNWENLDMSLEEIEADETERFGAMIGKTVVAYGRDDDTPVNETKVRIESVMTEEELVRSEGFEYLRLPAKDHTWPQPEVIDSFIDFVKGIEPDKSWLHFHCQAGTGRTGIMMMIYDMMQNPDVSMEDIVIRQTMMGAGYPLYTEDSDSYKVPLYEEKAKMTKLIYEYIQENHKTNYEVPWSQWLEKNEAAAEAAASVSTETAGETENASETAADSVADTETAAAEEEGFITVVLDPGHDDSEGCTNNHPDLGVNEQELNLVIGLACRDRLLEYGGIKVYMTREDGTCPDAENGGDDCIRARTDLTAEVDADLFVSLHCNGTTGVLGAETNGCEVYVPNYSEFREDCSRLGKLVIQNLTKLDIADGGVRVRIKEEKGNYDDGSVKDWYYLISNNVDAGYPAIIIEHAYMDNLHDNAILSKEENLKAMGRADADAIAAFYGLTLRK